MWRTEGRGTRGLRAPVAVLAAVLLVGPAAGSSRALRRAVVTNEVAETPEEIHKRWDKMDQFLKIMFTIGCKWKNEKDIKQLAASKLKDGTLNGMEEFDAFISDTMAKNVVMLKQTCGMIVANGKKKCRMGCSKNWNALVRKRQACDAKCVEVYNSFDKLCVEKAGNLEVIYKNAQAAFKAKKRCYEGHCPAVPTVHTMEDESKMNAEVDSFCAKECEEGRIEMRCDQKWQLEYDMTAASVASKCSSSGAAGECFNKKKGDVSAKQESCASQGKGKCESAAGECESKGKVEGSAPEAKGFCDERKKQCEDQVTKECKKAFDDGIAKLQAECEKEAGDAFDKCEEEALKEKEEAAKKACVEKKTPKCSDDCHASCDVNKMKGCLDNLKQDDATKDYCEDFWTMLHETAAVDPVTGDPIVLAAIASK